MTRCLLTLFVTLVLAASLAGADLSGIRSLELDPDFSGNQDTVGCGFTQLAIKCGGADIAGEVNNLRVTWQFKTGPDNAITATFSGVLDDQATTISPNMASCK